MTNISKNPVRRLYDWVLHWAHTPYGTPALSLIAFAESSFFPVPPDVLQIALSISHRKRSLFYAFVSTASSVAGAYLGYLIGSLFMDAVGWKIIHFYKLERYFHLVQTYYGRNAFLYVFTAAFTPIPYKVFTITAGVCSISLKTLFLASVMGRGLRFFAVGLLIHLFGERIKRFIDRYFNLLTVAFLILLVLGFWTVKYIF